MIYIPYVPGKKWGYLPFGILAGTSLHRHTRFVPERSNGLLTVMNNHPCLMVPDQEYQFQKIDLVQFQPVNRDDAGSMSSFSRRNAPGSVRK